MNTKTLILDTFGSATELARLMGFPHPSTVTNWYLTGQGIPPRHFPKIIELASARGRALSFGDLYEANQSGVSNP